MFFFRRKLKKYYVEIWKLIHIDGKNDPLLVWVGKDILKETVFGKPERHIFKLQQYKVEVEIPNQSVIYTKSKKDYIDLIQMDSLLYVPSSKRFIDKEIVAKFMSFDIDQFRLQSIENRNDFYSDKKEFFEKYGPMIMIFLAILTVIVVGWLAFDFIVKLQGASIQPMKDIAASLIDTARNTL